MFDDRPLQIDMHFPMLIALQDMITRVNQTLQKDDSPHVHVIPG